MNRSLVLLFALLFMTLAGQAQTAKYARAKILLEGRSIAELAQLGLEVDHGEIAPNRHIINDFSYKELALVEQAGFTYKILIEDVQAYYASQAGAFEAAPDRQDDCFEETSTFYEVPSNFSIGSMGGFFTYQEMLDHLDNMAALYPDLITARTPIDTFTSIEGRPIYWLKISDNPDQDETEPEVLYTTLHHAREPNSLSQIIFYMWYLLENYDTDPEVKYLVDNVEMYFIPCINPDGYIHNETTNPNGGGLWRKNKRDNDNNGIFEEDFDGVDLNRNYGFEWGFNDIGSSPNPQSATYRGETGFSEPETQAVKAFCNEHEFQVCLNYHTFGNLLIYPWGYSDEIADPAFPAIANLFTQENQYTYGTATETVNYNVNGVSDDWMYGENVSKPAIYSMTPEVGPGNFGFWPPSNAIIGLCQENVLQNLLAAHVVLIYGEVEDLSSPFVDAYSSSLPFRLNRFGLKDGPLIVSLDPVSANILSTGDPQTYTLDPFADIESVISFEIDPAAQPFDPIVFGLTVSNGELSWTDTLYKTLGGVETVFNDKADSLSNWEALNGEFGWDLTEEEFFSPNASITDSPLSEYFSNFTNVLEIDEPIDLTGSQQALLTFYAKWAIETNYDYVQVLASNDGQNYTPLCGKYTVEGTNNQADGEPVYEGFQNDWVKEEMDISEFTGGPLYLRFLLVSDGFIEEDGFYFDDLEVTALNDDVSSTSSPEMPEIALAIFPNPADQFVQFTIQGKDRLSFSGQMSVVTTLGQTIFSEAANSSNQSIFVNTNNWTPGVYFILLRDFNGNILKQEKLLIK